jgi:lipopolysaccharide biosynthesis protein
LPFVKVGLFRVNHDGLDPDHVLRGIRRATPYDVRLIEAHLRREGRPRATAWNPGRFLP